jgi:hypothetical protein
MSDTQQKRMYTPLYYKAHENRAKKSGVDCSLVPHEWEDKVRSSEGKCSYCLEFVGVDKLTMDHVIPFSRGGPHSIENVVPACLPCNCSKGASDMPRPVHLRPKRTTGRCCSIVVNMPPAKKQEIAYAAEAAKRSMSNYLLWCYEQVKSQSQPPIQEGGEK